MLYRSIDHPPRAPHRMIIELGHFAVVLALAVALVQMAAARLGRAHRRYPPDAGRRACRSRATRTAGHRLRRAHARLRHVGLLGRERVGQFAFGQAAALQDLRRVGEPRRLHAALGADPGVVRRGRRTLRPQPAEHAARQRAGRAGRHRRRLSPVHRVCIQSLHAHTRCSRKVAVSIRSCRTPRCPSTRPSFMRATSASRWPSPSPSPR